MESRQILQFGTVWNGRSSPFHIFPAVFWPFRLVFHPFFMILARNGKKTGAQKWRNGKGKNAFLSRFFPVPVFSRSLPGTSLVHKGLSRYQADLQSHTQSATRQEEHLILADVKATSVDGREQRCRQEKIGLQTL